MSEEKLCNVITLGDNIEYTEIDRINYNKNTYSILSDLDNPDNFCIKKIVIENNCEYVVNIDTKDEFDNALKVFTDKYTN